MTRRKGALREALTHFTPADDREATFRARMLALLDTAGDPFSRDHFDPGHFTASAFVLSPDGQDLLLILHGKLGLWLQPGGHIDPDDVDVFHAAKREVREETHIHDLDWLEGAPTIFDVDIHTIPARKADPDHEHFDVRIALRAKSREFVAGSDAKDGRWVPLGEVKDEETDESVMRAVRKLMGERTR